MFKKFHLIAQVVGYAALMLLAVYGLLTLLGGGPAMASALDAVRTAGANPVIPATFNYQGLLRNPDGSLTTGSYTITAKIYDLAKAGSELYTETFPSVSVRDGLFNIVLGDDPQGQSLQTVFSAAPRFIGITLVGQGGELKQRQRVHGVPWALYATNADLLDGQDANALVPPGTVVAYAGSIAPSGWLLCDGNPASRTQYSALFAAIGTAHGIGDGTTTFNLPDYRGRFLRGVDGSAGRDPDRSSRTVMNPGGNISNTVGSVQADQFKSHSHGYSVANTMQQVIYGSGGYNFWADARTLNTDAAGGNETRPVNAYVNWIIKY